MTRSRASPPMLPSPTPTPGSAAKTTLQKIWNLDFTAPTTPFSSIPRTSRKRLTTKSEETILYLAYGSNLSAETFRGNRGIRPISAINVHVPSLDLTFDLAGIPYMEPCFANTRYHVVSGHGKGYHKDRWTKGLIGVVYEVTPEDYRTIIATEGGGASYQDVVVPCYALESGGKVVDKTPSGKPFEAHTLLQPANKKSIARTSSSRINRPDPSYAQPSARYLKLITDGAEEHALPDDYLAYLHNIRPFTITTLKQRAGQGFIVTFFAPILMVLFGLGKAFADKEGKIPEWLANIMGLVFRILWRVYDGFLVKAFGDGERTIKETDGNKDGVFEKKDEESAVISKSGPRGGSVRLDGAEKDLRKSYVKASMLI